MLTKLVNKQSFIVKSDTYCKSQLIVLQSPQDLAQPSHQHIFFGPLHYISKTGHFSRIGNGKRVGVADLYTDAVDVVLITDKGCGQQEIWFSRVVNREKRENGRKS